MIPALPVEGGLDPQYVAFLDELGARGFAGDIDASYAARLCCATDNSVYQVIPHAIVLPRGTADVELIARTLDDPRFHGVVVSPRGGGTGTNGQSLTAGIVVDLSRHMHAILDVDPDLRWVRVQPGVVLDELNAHLRPRGVFFAPSLAPGNRATLGGMISTDACGKGSRVHGKTSQHVIELVTVWIGGDRVTSRSVSAADLPQWTSRPDRVGHAMRTIEAVTREHRDEIAARFPTLQRFMTGYDLAHVRDAATDAFNLNAILSGSEGTLAFITEATLRLTPLPAHRRLVVLLYASFDEALRSAHLLLDAQPGAIETIDATILDLAQRDEIWIRVEPMLRDAAAGGIAAVNLVEFEGQFPADLDARIAEVVARSQRAAPGSGHIDGHYVAKDDGEIALLWELRKKGVGLLGNAEGERRPIPFVEDTAVPPERLAEYIAAFRAILDEEGLRYGMFGHVDVGCLHVRPALNLRDVEDERRLRRISDRVVALVDSFGGVLWSEHGKGYRSEYSPRFFGPVLFADLCAIKRAFDPRNQLNPGKLAVPSGNQDDLAGIDAVTRGSYDRQIPAPALARYAVAVNCNGNGACFSYDPDTVMCPSSRITRDRIHSPKGRAGIMREWLRQLAVRDYDAARLHAQIRTEAPRPLAWVAARFRRRRTGDFSHEVYDAMAGCLACKACATQCPVRVDVPRFRSEFLALYHQRYGRPLSDYFVAVLEPALRVMGHAPRLVNALLSRQWARAALKRWVGIVDPPLLAPKPFPAQAAARGLAAANDARLAALSPQARARTIALVQDAFTSYYESDVVPAFVDVAQVLGFEVLVVPFSTNGKALHVKGLLRTFDRTAARHVEGLRAIAAHDVDLVCIEPAIALTYRDEYRDRLGTAADVRVALPQEWLASQQALLAAHAGPPTPERYVLLGHCTERTAEPRSMTAWQAVFAAAGLSLEIAQVGCCGMCGMYGHEARHYEESRGIYAQSWAPRIAELEARGRTVLATGYSCRSQAQRLAGTRLLHPAQVLAGHLHAGPGRAQGPRMIGSTMCDG